MNDILPQPDYLTISSSSDSTVTIAVPDLDIVTLDINNMSSSAYNYGGGYLSTDTITLSNIDLTGINWTAETKEFVDCFPNWSKISEMRNQYPALDIAMKKFEEVYKMVEDDWQAQQGNKYASNRS